MKSWAPKFCAIPARGIQSEKFLKAMGISVSACYPERPQADKSSRNEEMIFGLPVERRAAAPEEDGARVCRTRDCAERHEVGRSLRVPAGDDQGTAQARPDACDLPTRIRRRWRGPRGGRAC